MRDEALVLVRHRGRRGCPRRWRTVPRVALLANAAKYDAERRDGAFQVQNFTFDTSTNTFKYTGKPFAPATP